MSKKQQQANKILKIKIIIYMVICAIMLSSFAFYKPLEKLINYVYNPTISSDILSCELKVHFVDVGQGDCIVVELPDNKLMIVDAGPGKSEAKMIEYLDNVIFASRENKIVDYFVLTHQDEDHVGGADKIFDNYDVKNVFRPNVYTTQEKTDNNLNHLTSNNICDTLVFKTFVSKLQQEYNSGVCEEILENAPYTNMPLLSVNAGYNITFLSPLSSSYSDPNNYSPIIIITYQNRKIMLTGDAETKAENEVLANYSESELKCDILKLGHHGSSTSTSKNLLDAVSPIFAVICVGEGNKYNHPNPVVYERVVKSIGEQNIYRTDLNGSIVFGVDKDTTASKGEIKIAVNYSRSISVYIEWWYIVVTVLGVTFMFIFVAKRADKTLKKITK